jgi:transposase
LRNQRFFSLNELNEAIAQLVTTLNERRFKKMDGCRRSVFEATEQASLRPLPQQTYVFGVWMLRRVNIDYHVEINGHYYSVPYELVRQTVDARITAMTIELFHRGSRVASHPASSHKGKFTTQRAHMPPNHRVVAGWQPEVSLQQAQRIGPNTVGVIEVLLGRRNHMMQAYRSCTGVLRLAAKYGQHRLEKACQYALSINNISTGAIVSILENKLDCKLEHDRLAAAQGNLPVEHSNVRGPNYYH